MTAVDARPLRARWVLSCAAGEVIGITAAAAIAVGGRVLLGEPHDAATAAVVVAAAVAGGVVEGLAVGLLQWRVLRRVVPAITARAWAGVTVAVAATFWFLGTLPSTIVGLGAASTTAAQSTGAEPPVILVVAGGVAGGAVAGAAFGLAQWAVLRRHARPAGGWIWTNALGWAAALGWIMLAATLPTESTPLPVVVAGGALGGLAAGISVGIATGWCFVRLRPLRAGRRVVIGIGNTFRGDDGIGAAVAGEVGDQAGDDVAVVELDGEPARVVDAWRDASLAIVVDAMSAGSEPGTVRRFRVGVDALPPPAAGASSHSLGVAEAVELGTALGAMPATLVVYGVEGACYADGTGLSGPVDAARGRVVDAVLAELGS